MNEHTFAVSGVRCGVQGQHACGVPEATSVLDFMRPNSMEHSIPSYTVPTFRAICKSSG